MKKFITVLVLAFTLGMNAQSNEDIERYKLYPTTNMWTFLELDTATGLMWQIQYDVYDEDKRFKIVLNDLVLNDNEQLNGRWKLYPTQNMYQFLLVDGMLGNVMQIQWSKDYNRGIVDIID